MTQTEKLLARLEQIKQVPGLYEIVVYVTPNQTIGFWIVDKSDLKIEGEEKPKNVV